MAKEPRKPRIRRRRIIERPRLIRALDRSDARLRMLVAGPGYGKTTLCEQWALGDERSCGWFRARRSAGDVSVVARALVAAADSVVPGAGRRLLQRLAVTEDPEREATLLAEMLAEDLSDWPRHGWIVIDDYQHVSASVASEAFVETVFARSPLQLLVASRVRPSWVAARSVLGGEALEIPETELTMSADEVDEVLEGARTELGSGLVALAHGWPAVIGLAGMTPDACDIDAELPETLYDFFAEEVYLGLDPTVKTGLAILAEMPLVDRELSATILGPEKADQVCDEAVSLGILDEREGRLEFHSLFAAFLERRTSGASQVATDVLSDASAHYRGRGELDAAFDLTERAGGPEDVDRFVSEAMDELLNRAQLPTLELWVSRAASQVGETSTVLLAKAEIALRQGHHLTAQALCERVGNGDPSVAYRAFLTAGRAAHVGSREQEALTLYLRAEGAGANTAERRNAKWGQLTAASDLELDSATDLLEQLQSTRETLDATEAVHAAGLTLAHGLRFGAVQSLVGAKRVAELLPSVPDPFVRCTFGSTFSCALNLAAEYAHALEVSTAMLEDATEFRVEFAMPYAFLAQGSALGGLCRFEEAQVPLSHALAHAVSCTDSFGQQAVYAAKIRLLLHQRRVAEACALEPPDLSDSLPAMRGEVWGSRGLALACIGRLAEARRLADEIQHTTRAVEPTSLSLCINAIAALKSRDTGLAQSLRSLVSGAFAAGAVDFVVTSYRASPDLLVALLRDPETAEGAGYIVARACDEELVESMGLDVLEALDPVARLSTREREIYDLLCEGLPNETIAKRLFISPATVKVHVRHVYDKLGIRSRTALALNAASRRAQATPTAFAAGATSTSDTDG